ncbi:DUF2079 domain-containing protein [Candidatus Collierbacteria bacterium]|nr:DUF2079 domain-containing protein [Candidatus Collierbacteria bacterium]
MIIEFILIFMRIKSIGPKLFLLILFFYFLSFSFLSIRNHDLYQTFGWDLGFFDQLMWQASRGNLNFVSTIGNINLLGDHFQPVLYLLAPLYWAWDDVRVLLVAQALLITAAALPLYFLAKKKLQNEFLSISVSISYLIFAGTQFTITNEFHQSAFIPLLLLLGLYWLETDKIFRGLILVISLLLVKEETGFLLVALGIMYSIKFWKGPALRSKAGPLLILAGTIGFFLLVRIVIPAVSSQDRYIHYGYGSLGETPVEVVKSVVNNPKVGVKSLIEPKIKLEQVGVSILSFGGLPLLSPVSLIPVFQNYAVRFLDDRNIHRWLNNNHYSVPLGPLLAYAAILTIEKLKSKKLLAVYLVVTSIIVAIFLKLPVFSFFKSQLYFTPKWVKDIESIVNLVPANVSVAANNSVFPHLSHRDKIYLLPEIKDAEYIILDLEDGPNKYSPFDYSRAIMLSEKLENESWDKIAVSGKSIMFRRPKGL